MRLAFATFFMFIAVLATGCARKPAAAADPSAPSADAQTLGMVRRNFQQADPGARVGVVTQVLTEQRLAAVGEVDVREFRDGDAITFVDTLERPIIHGRVLFVATDQVHVKYEAPRAGQRAPREGDLAVRLTLTP